MAEIILDFIQCHHCGERYKLNDPSTNNHWVNCPNSPARKIAKMLLHGCEIARSDLEVLEGDNYSCNIELWDIIREAKELGL